MKKIYTFEELYYFAHDTMGYVNSNDFLRRSAATVACVENLCGDAFDNLVSPRCDAFGVIHYNYDELALNQYCLEHGIYFLEDGSMFVVCESSPVSPVAHAQHLYTLADLCNSGRFDAIGVAGEMLRAVSGKLDADDTLSYFNLCDECGYLFTADGFLFSACDVAPAAPVHTCRLNELRARGAWERAIDLVCLVEGLDAGDIVGLHDAVMAANSYLFTVDGFLVAPIEKSRHESSERSLDVLVALADSLYSAHATIALFAQSFSLAELETLWGRVLQGRGVWDDEVFDGIYYKLRGRMDCEKQARTLFDRAATRSAAINRLRR